MADLSGLAAFGGGFANAMPEAQRRYLALQQQQMELDQARRAIAAKRAAMSGFGGGDPGLGNLPGAQPLPGAQAPPQGGPAMQATPGQMALRPGPQGLVPAQGAPPLQGPMLGAQPQPGPQMGGGPQMPMGGTLTVEQLAERIRQRNPGIDGATLFEAVKQANALLNPESKMWLNYLIAQQREGRWDRPSGNVVAQQEGAGARAQLGAQSRMNVAQAMIGARRALAQGQEPDEATLQAIAESRSYGDTSVMNLGWGAKTRTKIMGMAANMAQSRGSTLAAEDANYKGTTAATGVIGRTAGSVAIGAAEIPQLVPLIMESSRKLDLTQYPTVNAVELAYARGTGDANVVQLNSYIQTLRNAYNQISQRGGRVSDHLRQLGEKLVDGTMAPNQLAAAAQAMVTEAGVVKGATGGAMRDVTTGLGQRPKAPPVGTVQDGYRFKGGDPASQSSWERVP